jgi:predicted AAA+ superfamily ATPase
MLIFEARFFSPSAYKQRRNPPKIYMVDPGLAIRAKSQDWGRTLENVVFLELKRRGYDIYYYMGKKECDFILKESNRNLSAMQVAWEVTDDNKQREYEGLVEACKSLKKARGTIITRDQYMKEKVSGINIKNSAGVMIFIPWKFLRSKRCLSPLRIKSALPATANSRNLLSDGCSVMI